MNLCDECICNNPESWGFTCPEHKVVCRATYKQGDFGRAISTTRALDTFACEAYVSAVLGGKRVQWDYRDSQGKLHSGIAKTIEQAQKAAMRFGYRP